MPVNLPFPIFGRIYDTDGTTLIGAGITVRARNNSTNELLSVTTNSASEYSLDAGNFASGYDNTDKVTVYIIYSNLEAEVTLTISDNKHQFHLTLTTVSDSTLISLTTVQNVYDELDGIGETDITAKRVIRAVQEAESEIEEKSGMKFASTTVTQEIYDWNEYTTYKSAEQLASRVGIGRTDYWNVNFTDVLQLRNRPIISITTLQRNTAGESASDSWETLDENTGSSGDFVLNPTLKSAGLVSFVGDKPRYGKRAVRITYNYGYSTTPKNIQRLATLLAVRTIVLSKISRSIFDTPHGFSLRGIMIDRSGAFSSYIEMISKEIDRLWVGIGFEFRVV